MRPFDRASHPATWDALAPRYARQARGQRQAIAAAVDLAGVQPSDRVLDVATGTGAILAELLRRPHPPRRVVAVDRSSGMLAQLTTLAPGWTVQAADARGLPLADAGTDVAFASYLLHLLAEHDRGRVLAELHRVLAAEGRLVTVTPHVPPRGSTRLGAFALRGLAVAAPTRFGGLRPHDPRAELQRAGFALVHAIQVRHGYPSLVVLARRR